MRNSRKKLIKNLLQFSGVLGFFLMAGPAMAQEGPELPSFHESMYSEPLFIALLIAAIFLLVLIMVLAEIVRSALHHNREMARMHGGSSDKKKDSSGGAGAKVTGLLTLLLGLPALSKAQQAVEPLRAELPEFRMDYWGVDALTFWVLILFIVFELVIALYLLKQVKNLLGRASKTIAPEKVAEERPALDWFNASVAIEEEETILMDHDYDGIKELDNNLPPWWKYGFYFTIVWSLVYVAHFHIFKTGLSQEQEYLQAMADAEKEVEAYKKLAANFVDENTVEALTDEAALSEGKNVFVTNCAACHGQLGEGNSIGPNLTDAYWLHGGDIKDVFKSVKYGWPEKGMRSWQNDLSSRQIHTVASYIKSLAGSNPPNAKEPQGDLWSPEGTAATVADTAAVVEVADSTVVE